MEAMVAAPVENGQQLKSPIEVVSNVGLLSAFKKSSTTMVSIRVQQLHDQLETARQENDGLWEEVETLKAQTQVSQETIDNMKWSMDENNNLLHQLLSFNQCQVPPS
jgi:hypothetical protein